MSVSTNADERVASAVQHMRAAAADLMAAVLEPSMSEYTADYRDGVYAAMAQTTEILRRLDGNRQ